MPQGVLLSYLSYFPKSSERGTLNGACRALSDLKQTFGNIVQGLLEVSITELVGRLQSATPRLRGKTRGIFMHCFAFTKSALQSDCSLDATMRNNPNQDQLQLLHRPKQICRIRVNNAALGRLLAADCQGLTLSSMSWIAGRATRKSFGRNCSDKR